MVEVLAFADIRDPPRAVIRNLAGNLHFERIGDAAAWEGWEREDEIWKSVWNDIAGTVQKFIVNICVDIEIPQIDMAVIVTVTIFR
jgi:hypothetical protein